MHRKTFFALPTLGQRTAPEKYIKMRRSELYRRQMWRTGSPRPSQPAHSSWSVHTFTFHATKSSWKEEVQGCTGIFKNLTTAAQNFQGGGHILLLTFVDNTSLLFFSRTSPQQRRKKWASKQRGERREECAQGAPGTGSDWEANKYTRLFATSSYRVYTLPRGFPRIYIKKTRECTNLGEEMFRAFRCDDRNLHAAAFSSGFCEVHQLLCELA